MVNKMVKLREYQKDLINQIKNEMREGKKSVCAVLGCGGGKSIIQGMIAKSATDKGNRVLFLIHRKELAEQIEKTFTDCGVNLTLCDICMVQTAARHIDKLLRPELIITDEAHHSAAAGYKKIYAEFPDALRIGFTATPARLGGGGLNTVFDSMVEGVSTKWLIDNHYLAPYKYYSVKLVDTAGLHRRNGEYIQSEVEALMSNKAIYGDVMNTWHKFADRRKTIVYCSSVKSSTETAEHFKKAGIAAAHLDGKTPKAERERIISEFRNGNVTILSNVDLFGEGFDVPDCECVILLRPTLSLTVHIQQSMRSMRYRDNKTAIIIDHVGNVFRHGLPDDVREWSLEEKEQRKDKCEKYRSFARQCGKCFATLPAAYNICPYCGTELKSERGELEQKEAEIEEITRETLKNAPYSDYLKCRTFDELNAFRKARGYKFAWTLRKCVEMGIPYPPQYNYTVRRFIYAQRA